MNLKEIESQYLRFLKSFDSPWHIEFMYHAIKQVKRHMADMNDNPDIILDLEQIIRLKMAFGGLDEIKDCILVEDDLEIMAQLRTLHTFLKGEQ